MTKRENIIENIKSYYNLIFSFPSFKVIFIAFVFVTSVFISIPFIIIKDYLLKHISLIFLFSIFLQMLFSRIFIKKIMSIRRLLALYTIILFEFIVIVVLIEILSKNQLSVRVFESIIPLYSFIFLVYVIFTKKWFLSLGLISLTLIPLLLVMINEIFAIIIAFSLFISIDIFILLFIEYIDRGARRILKINGLDLIYGFINIFLANDAKIMENLFSKKLCKKIKADFYIMYFTSSNGKIVGSIFIPGIHFGPFRNFGSSTFPSKMVKKFEGYGIPVLILHRASTHEEDLISSEECNAIIKKSLEMILMRKGIPIKTTIFKRNNLGTLSCFFQCLSNDTSITIICEEKNGIEDIPREIEKHVSSLLNKKILIIDAHNRDAPYLLIPSLNNYLGKNIVDLIIESISNCINEKYYKEIKVGFYTLQPNINFSGELASGGITIMVVEYPGKKRYFLISVDSNNIMPGIRDSLRKFLIEKYGFDDGDIVTTDTHENTGILPGTYYFPLGKNTPLSLIRETIERGIKNAITSMQDCTIYFVEKTIEVKSLGKENLEKINTFISKYVKLSILTMLGLMLFPIVLALFT